MSKKVFVSGDMTHPLFHPFWNVKEEFYQIFDAEPFEITLDTEHFETLEAKDYAAFDLVVLYTDHWIDKSPTVHQQVQALLHYVAQGGKLLVLHNFEPGVDPEMAQLLGGKLNRPLEAKPIEAKLTFTPSDHPAALGVPAFTLDEQIFGITYDPLTVRDEILTATLPDGQQVPAGWSVNFGEGCAVYLSPGHDQNTFRDPAYTQLLRQVASWMTEEV